MSNSLDFEQPIVDLEAKIDELRRVDVDGALDLHREIERLETKSRKLTREIFSSLDAWQITQLARHPQRPHTLDYISRIFSNFQELSGDRMYRDDPAVVGGLARIGGKGVMIIVFEFCFQIYITYPYGIYNYWLQLISISILYRHSIFFVS